MCGLPAPVPGGPHPRGPAMCPNCAGHDSGDTLDLCDDCFAEAYAPFLDAAEECAR